MSDKWVKRAKVKSEIGYISRLKKEILNSIENINKEYPSEELAKSSTAIEIELDRIIKLADEWSYVEGVPYAKELL